MAFLVGDPRCLGEAAKSGVSELRTRDARPSRCESSSERHPNPPPVSHRSHSERLVFIDAIASILGKLFDCVVIREHVAMNASQQWNGNFQDWNKQMIRGFADWPPTIQQTHRNKFGNGCLIR